MQTDFIPIHLKQANDALDKHVLAPKDEQETEHHIEIPQDKSLWERLLALFK